MKLNKLEAIGDKTVFFGIFKRVEGCLRQENIEPGLPRFLEFANLLFLKLLEERQQQPLWGSLKAEPNNKIEYLNGILIPILQTKYDATGVFAETQMAKEGTIKKIVAILDNCRLASFDSDILGDAYEYFLQGSPSQQSLGQYFTPRHIVKVLVGLVSPTNGDTVYDPFCGTGGLLTGAFNAIQNFDPSKKEENMFFGKDVSISTRVAKMNAILHWGDHSGIEQVENTLAHPIHERYFIGLTNVPFARDPKNYPYDGLYENGLAKKKTDVLSIFHLFQSIKKGGRMAAIVPEGFLFGTERKAARRFLTDNADLRLVASLPHGAFLPYTNVKTALIYLENIRCSNRKDHFWYFDVENDGWTLDKHRKRIEGPNDLDVLQNVNLNGTPEDLTSLGFVKVPFEKIRQNQENWIGKHYQDGGTARSPYPLVALGKLVTFVSTGFSYKVDQLSDNGIPLFTLKSVKKEFFPHCETKYLRYETQTNEKNACVAGDILVAMKDKNGESPILGRATIANRNGVFSSDLVKIEVKAENLLSSEYLYYVFKNETYIKEIKKFSAGSIVKSISLEDMVSINIPLPPLTVQKEVVNEFNRYERLILAQNETANFFREKCRERLRALWE